MELAGAAIQALNSKQDASGLLRSLFEVLGVWDQIVEISRRYNSGRITEDQLYDEGYPLFLRALATTFEWEENRYADHYFALRRQGNSCNEALEKTFDYFDSPSERKVLMSRVIDELYQKLSELNVPPDIMSRILGAAPRVRPVFTGLPARSLLARVALEADLFCKNLMDMPEIKKRISAYHTFFEFERSKGYSIGSSDGRTWIAADGFEVNESAEGNAIRFGRTPMRFHFEKYVGRNSKSDPLLDEYGQELSTHYDALAQEFPILHELRECSKIVAIATWLKQRGILITLPSEGRAYWNPPTELPGVIHMSLATKTGSVGAVLTASGGIDLRVDKSWKFTKIPSVEIPPGVLISPIKSANEQADRIFHGIDKIQVPLPEIPGWVGQARGGERALSYVSIRQDQLSKQTDAAEALIQLDKVRQKAKMLDYYDRIINASTKERVESMTELEGLKEEANKKEEEMIDEFSEFLVAMNISCDQLLQETKAVNTRDRRSAQHLLALTDDIGKVKEMIKLLTDEMGAGKQHTFDADRWTKITENLAKLSVEVRKQMMETDPRVWVYAEETAIRSTLYLNVLFYVAKLADKTMYVWDLHRMTSDINDSLGDRAKELGQVQKMRQKYVDDYNDEKRKLEAMLN